MLRIKLIVTGDMEKRALHTSLQRFFPERCRGQKVVWEAPQKTNGATSHRLEENASLSEGMKALARAMLAAVKTGKTGQPADLVLVVDDLELGNLGREAVVVEHFRRAVKEALLGIVDSIAQREMRECVRERCSFHLLSPMPESYFFGDPHALITAGVPAEETPRLIHPTDVELFESNDPAWLPYCHVENERMAEFAPFWRHECHPKHYLEHLTQRGKVFYDETRQGKNALAGLAWDKVPKVASDVRLIRSLFEDLSAWFDIQNPLGVGATHPNLFPEASVKPADLLLRNL